MLASSSDSAVLNGSGPGFFLLRSNVKLPNNHGKKLKYSHFIQFKPLILNPAYDLAAMRMRRRFTTMRMRRKVGRYAQAHTIWPLCACADDLAAMRMRRRFSRWAAMRMRRLLGRYEHAQTILPLCAYVLAAMRMRRLTWLPRHQCPGNQRRSPGRRSRRRGTASSWEQELSSTLQRQKETAINWFLQQDRPWMRKVLLIRIWIKWNRSLLFFISGFKKMKKFQRKVHYFKIFNDSLQVQLNLTTYFFYFSIVTKCPGGIRIRN